MIAEQVIDLGALVLAYTWCPVPLKSKMAVLVYLLIVRARLIKVPSSMQSYEITVSISFNQLLREILQSIFLMDSSALSYIHSMYWIVVSNEVSDISSINKCTPLLLEAICACKSLILSLSSRLLLKSCLVSSILSCPFSTILKLFIATPSSSNTFEKGGIDPGVIPPISAWCPLEATQNLMVSPI